MQKLFKTIGIIVIVSIIVFAMLGCTGNNNVRVLNSADALKEFLDRQPANSPDKPINVVMNVNDLMLTDISGVISSAGKFVNLDLSRSGGLTTIGDRAFRNNRALTGLILPNTVRMIGREAFDGCINLNTITVSGTDASLNGTWINVEHDDYYIIFNNGSLLDREGELFMLYTTNDGILTLFSIKYDYESVEFGNYSVNKNKLTIISEFDETMIFTKK